MKSENWRAKKKEVILTSNEGGSNVHNRCVRGEDGVKEDLALSIRTEVDCPEKDTMQLDIVIITVQYVLSDVCLLWY